MIVIGSGVLGAVFGARLAKTRGGSNLDMAQYAAGFGIACALAGTILTVIIHRMAV